MTNNEYWVFLALEPINQGLKAANGVVTMGRGQRMVSHELELMNWGKLIEDGDADDGK